MLYAIVAVIVLILDQGMKYWTTLHLELNAGVKELIPGLIHLRNYHNTGSAFSMFGDWAGARWMFLIVTVLFAVLVILALAKKLITGKFGRWMALGILAGALGNGIDRMLYGYVVDMFQFGFWQTFPIFNVADIFITVCGVLFCVYILLHKDPLSAPAGQTLRKGPGGSITTKPAPKRVEKPAKAEKPEKAEKPAASAPRRLAKEEKAAPKFTMPKLPTLPKREEKPAPKRAAKPAAERRPFFEKEEEAPVAAPKSTRVRRTAKQGEVSPLESLERPVVTRESFIEMTRRKPGDDPFAEWTQTKAEPAPVVEPVVETPVREVQPELPVFETNSEPVVESAAVTETAPVAEPEPVKAPEAVVEPVKAETEADMEFSLEDILNEFRDI